jgi:putative copper resistance protein D
LEFTGWDAAAALAKATSYATTLGAAGAIFFLAYSERLLRPAQRRSILRNVLILSAVAALASTARISLLAASMSGSFGDMFDLSSARMILSAGEGWAIALRILGLTLCVAAFKSGRRWSTAACIGAMLAAASFAAVGHVHALKPDRLPTAILVLHLTCAAFWLGALWPLLRVAGDGDKAVSAALAARFGKAALYVVGMLIGAGVLLGYQLLGSLGALWSSDYGRMLSLKLLLVAALLSAAAVNKLSLTPRLQAGDAAAAAALRRSIRFEMILGGLILLVTAAFTSLTGPPT